MRRQDDLVAGADPERHQRGEQGIGATRHRDAVRGADILCESLLEFRDFGTEYVLTVCEHPVHAFADRGFEVLELGL